MHVALHRRHQDLAGARSLPGPGSALFLVHERQQISNGLFHHPRRFDDLGQKHFSRTEKIADDIHARHQRPFDDIERLCRGGTRFLDIAIDEFGDAVDERMFEPLLDRLAAPDKILFGGLRPLPLVAFGEREQSFGRIRPPVEDDILAGLAEVRFDFRIDRELARVDDAHIHAGGNRVIEKHRMHGLAHRLVAAKREGKI